MSSKIEQLIEEIEDYIDGCKFQPLSKVNKIINVEEMDELLRELKSKTPDEIQRYQQIISQREEILQRARDRADQLINDATAQTNQLINEHEIMQQAYAQANEVVTLASEQAQAILDNATVEANNVREAAMQYLDDMLKHLDDLMSVTVSTTTTHYESFLNQINQYHEVVLSNRAELHPVTDLIDEMEEGTAPSNGNNEQN